MLSGLEWIRVDREQQKNIKAGDGDSQSTHAQQNDEDEVEVNQGDETLGQTSGQGWFLFFLVVFLVFATHYRDVFLLITILRANLAQHQPFLPPPFGLQVLQGLGTGFGDPFLQG